MFIYVCYCAVYWHVGNELMRKDQYAAAVESYTQAIQLDNCNAVYYCNRSVCLSAYMCVSFGLTVLL